MDVRQLNGITYCGFSFSDKTRVHKSLIENQMEIWFVSHIFAYLVNFLWLQDCPHWIPRIANDVPYTTLSFGLFNPVNHSSAWQNGSWNNFSFMMSKISVKSKIIRSIYTKFYVLKKGSWDSINPCGYSHCKPDILLWYNDFAVYFNHFTDSISPSLPNLYFKIRDKRSSSRNSGCWTKKPLFFNILFYFWFLSMEGS